MSTFLAKPKSETEARAKQIEILRKKTISPNAPIEVAQENIDNLIEEMEKITVEEEKELMEQIINEYFEAEENDIEMQEILEAIENGEFEEDFPEIPNTN